MKPHDDHPPDDEDRQEHRRVEQVRKEAEDDVIVKHLERVKSKER